ncbi:hypothetical protein L596_025051 [Steinernema carpocapsae]|uniref:ABC transporter domain-containing protein n=1 Tax=Steinernema carpocapsae TaxID=34508 RepID=A0A4U5M6N3_STECR|nr:hypothetical protein L596_025051 [Steinernema carpocapsae]
MRRSFRQFGLLMGKHGRQMLRRPCITLFEVGFPLLFLPMVVIFVQLSAAIDKTHMREEVHFKPIPLHGNYEDLVDVRWGLVNGTEQILRCENRYRDSLISFAFDYWTRQRTLLYYSKSKKGEELMLKFTKRYRNPCNGTTIAELLTKKIESKSEMQKMLKEHESLLGGVTIDEISTENPKLSYTLLLPEDHSFEDLAHDWDEHRYVPPINEYSFSRYHEYGRTGVASIQRGIDQAFLEMAGKARPTEGPLYLQRLQIPTYRYKKFPDIFMFFYTFGSLFLLFVVSFTAWAVVDEKKSGMKAYLAVMGLNHSMFHFSHWLLGFFKAAVPLILGSIPLIVKLENSDPSLFVVVILVYCAAVASFTLLMASVFRSALSVIVCSMIIWCSLLITSIIPVIATRHEIGISFLQALNPTCALSFAIDAFFEAEMGGPKLDWKTMFIGSSHVFTVGLALEMLIASTFWMSLLTIYLDNVVPMGDSAKKPPLFFINWIWKRKEAEKSEQKSERKETDSSKFESESRLSDDDADICVENLRKVWKGHENPAVDGLNFKAYRGQVNVLLGHNGAGKSTTFSIISGITSPSSGSVKICNRDIVTKLNECRQKIGYCPQTNPLFDYLTVKEHLIFFQGLKKGPESALDDDIDDLIYQLGLQDQAKTLARKLSGGMKRKLCLGMSLVGGSRVVLLDEPTAGMDPGSRNLIGALLERNKRDRTILLTTHYTDEADRLGDRIAIMVKGRLECQGSPEFLKRRFGAGYILSIDISKNAEAKEESAVEEPLESKVQKIKQLVKDHFPEVTLEKTRSNQIEALLPINSATDGSHSRFVSLFEDLETQGSDLSVGSFGVSLNSLEQVFIKVTEDSSVDQEEANQAELIFEENDEVRRQGIGLWLGQFCALFQKRCIYFFRNPIQGFFQIVFPFLLILIGVLVSDVGSEKTFTSNQNRTFHLDSLGEITMPLDPKMSAGFRLLANQHSKVIVEFSDSPHALGMPYPPIGIGFVMDGEKQTAIYNGQAYHSSVLVQNFYANALIGIKDAITFTLELKGEDSEEMSANQEPKAVASEWIILTAHGLAFSILTSTFVYCVVEERQTNFKHQQLLTRLNIAHYWFAIIFYDCLIYVIVCILAVIVFASYKTFEGYMGLMILLWVLYFFLVVPFIYCVSFFFKSPFLAFLLVVFWNVIASRLVLEISKFLLHLKDSIVVREVFNAVSILLFPSYGLNYGSAAILAEKHQQTKGDLFVWNKLGCVIVLMLGVIEFYWTLLFLIQSRTAGRMIFMFMERFRRRASDAEDPEDVGPDVEEEIDRMSRISDEELSLSVRSLNKFYGKLHAVKDLTFGVKKDQCFGLLGANGAGKTTTFDILTGLSRASSGDVVVNGVDLKEDRYTDIGYCPQFDAFLEQLTAKETLKILARLHGFRRVNERVATVLKSVKLTEKADKKIKSFSGGQKRRLALGVALLSQTLSPTQLILLDEPSAGLDPCVRRHIWNILKAARSHNCAILLTSHSMPECEALCGRIGFLQRGKMVHLGTPQHLKTKYGSGFQLSLTVEKPSIVVRDKLNAVVVEGFGANGTTSEATMPTYSWSIPKGEDSRWSTLFKKLDAILARFPSGTAKKNEDATPAIKDSSLEQNTLEQVFLRFVQPDVTQIDGADPVKPPGKKKDIADVV